MSACAACERGTLCGATAARLLDRMAGEEVRVDLFVQGSELRLERRRIARREAAGGDDGESGRQRQCELWPAAFKGEGGRVSAARHKLVGRLRLRRNMTR